MFLVCYSKTHFWVKLSFETAPCIQQLKTFHEEEEEEAEEEEEEVVSELTIQLH